MGSRSCSVQELVFFLFLGAIPRAFRIVPLHFRALFHRELRKMADEADQFPTVVLAAVDAAKGGHAGEAHAVFNDPEKFAVRETLCFQQAQVGWLRIETLANQCVSAAVVGVAGGAMIRKMEARIAQVFSGGGNGILRRAPPFCESLRHLPRQQRRRRHIDWQGSLSEATRLALAGNTASLGRRTFLDY